MIHLSERAAGELKAIVDQEIEAKHITPQTGLRLILQGGGCAGFAYRMGFDENRRPGDKVFRAGGIDIVVDTRSYLYLKGTEIDFQDDPMGKGFVFHNPNAPASGCSCGH